MPHFVKQNLTIPLPQRYRLATLNDVRDNQADAFQALPGWDIVYVADGWVEGCLYGGKMG